MQKKIIALAIAAALTTPALALAEATVYGQMNLSIDYVKNGMLASGSNNQLNSNTSRLGLKGSEDLGGGLNAIWQVEGTLIPDTGTSPTAGLFDRNNFLGLSSASIGTVIVGKNDTPYKTATRRMDLFGDGIADNRKSQVIGGTSFTSTMMGAGHDARVSNAIQYNSPSMGGFTVAASTVFGGETAAAGASKGTMFSLAGMFEQGPIYATLAYQNVKAGSAGTGDLGAGAGTSAFNLANVDDESKALKLGAGYTMDAFAVNAVIEQHTNTINSTKAESKGTNLYLSGKFNISSTDAVKAAFAKRGSLTGLTTDAKQYTVGYDHGMSKATTVYALYSKLTDNTLNAADPQVFSVGMRHSF